ncbi:MAG: hypothetical protein KGD65_11295, partial [Candidatus Lokiarchaeota archaeon]|nr:hypothetical protein [Candidatus Lokiarchaeota archaeon]
MSEIKKPKHPSEIYIRSYPKIIFFWPLLITSFILWIIEALSTDPEISGVLGMVWFIVFFVNIFITAFDFSSTKFFVLILAIVIILLLVVFLVPGLFANLGGLRIDLTLTWQFYVVMTLILAFILGIVIISTRFEYYKVERNE